MLGDMRKIEAEAMKQDGLKVDQSFYARVNAQVTYFTFYNIINVLIIIIDQVVRDAEEYYRGMYLMKNTWNIRDKHMANTLDDLMKHFEGLRAAGTWLEQ